MDKEQDSSSTTDSDSLPMTPVSGVEDNDHASDALNDGTPANPPDRKLTIRVPMEYAPPTPPPSASLPAIPPRRHSLVAPVSSAQRNRSSAPIPTSPPKALVTADMTSSSEPASPSIPHVLSAVPEAAKSVPPKNTLDVPGDQRPVQKTILVSRSHSAIHLPTAAKEAQLGMPEKQVQAERRVEGASEKQQPRYGAELLPNAAPPVSRPRRKSAPGQRHNTLHPPPPPRVRKSPSISNSPSHVSLIDFESSDEEDEDESGEGDERQTSSIPEEDETPTPQHRRRESQKSDLSRWAPEPVYLPQQPSISVSFPARPPPPPPPGWATGSRSSISTSGRSTDRPSSSAGGSSRRGPKHHTLFGMSSIPAEMVQRDVDFTLRALMSPEMFASMLADPLARQRFREFLAVDGSTAELDFWTDTRFLAQSIEQLHANGLAFRDLYVSSSSEGHVPLSPEVRRELLGALQHVLGANASLGSTQAQLLESLYNNQFQRFVKHKIIQETHVTLGKANLMSQDSEGLGDTFVLTNPRLPDHPIVLVSDGFVDVTGYPKAQIIGRNCRFLQGPGTPPASVQRIRDGLNSGQGCTELLLNYRRNGEPFYCLLCIIPVRDTSGSIVYFIGGQTNVTGLLATDKGLGLHVAGDSSSQPIQMSPTLAQLREQSSGPLRPVATDPNLRTRGAAAGTVSSNPRTPNGSGFFRGLFGRASAGGARPDGKQVIAGAEAMMNMPGACGLQDQYAMFQNTYNKILVFKFKKREITFVSPQMLAFLGLPTRTQRELYASPLIRNDIASLVTAGDDRNETRRLRDELKDNIRRGTPCSLCCAIKIPVKGLLTRSDSARHKFGMMHMTPIKDGDNVAVAFVAIFG